MFEKDWLAVAPQLFTVDGSSKGLVTVADTAGFKVKAQVVIQATALPNLTVEVKRVLNKTQMYIGAINKSINDRSIDLTSYTIAAGAFIYQNEQPRNTISPADIVQAVYDQEPGVRIRTGLIDKYGNSIDNVVDNNGVNRLAVDGQFTAEVDVQVDVDIEGVYDPTTNPDPDSIGLIGHTRSNPTNQTHQAQRQTAKRGTTNTDTVSADVSIHDHSGNEFTQDNPLPVSSSGLDRFFALIAASKWMELATYDQVIPLVVGPLLTLKYYEDGAFLGEAIVNNYTSPSAWDLQLKRYIDDDDGTQLLDDDDVPLNLD